MCVVFMLSSPHQINWLRVDEEVPPHAVVTGSDLYIENLNKSYNGTYRCVASNAVGEAYDDYILYVYGRYSLHSMFKRPHHSTSHQDSVCIADTERFIDFAPCCSFCAVGGLYWNYKDLLQRLCDKQNHISNIYGCAPLLWGTESLKSQKLAAVDKSTELRIGFWDLSCHCTINA